MPRARNYDIDPSGRHFLMLRDEGDVAADRIDVVANWLQELSVPGPLRSR